MKCLNCNAQLQSSTQCYECHTNQEEFLFQNLEKLSLDQILVFIFQSDLFDVNVNSIKAALNDLLIYKKKEKNILDLLLKDDLLDKVINVPSLEKAERLVIIETKNIVDTFEINQELIYNILGSLVQAIRPEFLIKVYVKKDVMPETVEKKQNKFKLIFLLLAVIAAISISGSFLKTLIESAELISEEVISEELISIIFMYDDERIIIEYNAESGSEVKIPIAENKEGLRFMGWDDGEAFMEDGGDVLEVPPSDRVFTAIYEVTENVLYRVIFEDYDGSIMYEGYHEENYIIDAPYGEKEGYAFSGWFNGETLLYEIRSIRVPNHDITYTAVYQQHYTAFDVVFEDYDGFSILETRIREGGSIKQSNVPIPSRTGFVFKGWKYNGTVLPFDYGLIDNINENRVYTAVYDTLENSEGYDHNTVTLSDIYDKLSSANSGSFNIVGTTGFINEVSKHISPGLTCIGSCQPNIYEGHVIIHLSENLTDEEQFALDYVIPPIAIKSIENKQYLSIEDDGRYIIAIRGPESYAINVIKSVFN
ncbi:InlB B-repeat-containing protein [Mycoplasmatota bacterium WC44]